MTSLKDKIAKATPGLSAGSEKDDGKPRSRASSRGGDSDGERQAEKYMLRVTAGPSYDPSTHRIVHVNGTEPTSVESEAMSAKIRVRVRGYRGLPLGSPDTSSYFSDPLHKNDLYSISFSFVPKKDLPTQHLVWGNDFDHPVRDRLPPGFNTAFKIVKSFIDPGLECDAYADEPWLYGPALSCWFKFRIGDQQQQIEQAKNSGSSQSMDDDHYVVHEGADGTGSEARNGLPEDAEKRRKYFLDVSHRGKFSFERGRLYEADFHNPYLDFANYSLKLPGFSLTVIKYIGEKTHTLRYVFKNRETGEVFFVIVFTLLFGAQLDQAMKESRDGNAA